AIALRKVDSYLYDGNGVCRVDNCALLIERARLHAALHDPAQAEHDIDEFLRIHTSEMMWYDFDGQSALIRSFLRDDRGDAQNALADRHVATFREFLKRHQLPTDGDVSSRFPRGLNGLITVLISGSLTDDLTDSDIQGMLANTLAQTTDAIAVDSRAQ